MTKYKSFRAVKRNPQNSIPIKFQYLVDTLGDIKDIPNIHIYFDPNLGKTIGINQPGWNNRRLKGYTADLSSFTEIINISYSPYNTSFLVSFLGMSAWSIRIISCTKEKAIKINILLKDIILPIIKEWLYKQKTDVWYINRHYLQVGFNEELSKYCILETQEGNIIRKVIKDV